MKFRSLFCALLMGTCAAAFADGDVVVDVDGNSDDESGALARGADGRLYGVAEARNSPIASGTAIYVLAFDANGQRITTFGTAGKVTGELGPVAVRADGSVINGNYRVLTHDAAGTLRASFTACGVFYPCSGMPRIYTNSFLPLPDGRAFSGGGEIFRVFTSSYWTMVLVNVDGTKDLAYAGNADGWSQKNGGSTNQIVELRRQSPTQFLALGWDRLNGDLALGRFNLDGSTDFAFGTNGVMDIGTSTVFAAASAVDARNIPLGVDSAQRILVPGDTNIVARRLANGAVDGTYTPVPTAPQTTYLTFVVDASDRVVVFGQRNGAIYVARLLPNGGLDASFGTGGETTFTPAAPATSTPVVTDGLVDDTGRPILYFHVAGSTGAKDIGLARLTTGGLVDATFGNGIADADVYPDPITFASNTAPYGTVGVVSDPVTVSGINAPTNIGLFGSGDTGFSVGCTGTFVQGNSTISAGQTVCLRHSLPSTPGATKTTTLSIGGRQATYTTTATGVAADTTPDPFTITDQTGVTPNTQVTSAPVTITGLTGVANIAIDFGQFSIGCTQNFSSAPRTITNGETVCVRVTASASFSTPVSAVLAVNGVTDTFTATTVAADTTPDPYQLNAVGAVGQSEYVNSFTITMTGLNSPAPISVVGGEYALGCGAGTFTAQAGTINNGQTVCVRHVSAATAGTTVTTTLTVGGVSAPFTSTTAGSASSSSSSGGGSGGGGRFGAELALLALLVGYLRVWPALRGRRRLPA